MASRQGMIRTTIALGIAFTLGAPLTASAQAPEEARTSAPAQGAAVAQALRPVHRAGRPRSRWSSTVHARGRRPGPPLGSS